MLARSEHIAVAPRGDRDQGLLVRWFSTTIVATLVSALEIGLIAAVLEPDRMGLGGGLLFAVSTAPLVFVLFAIGVGTVGMVLWLIMHACGAVHPVQGAVVGALATTAAFGGTALWLGGSGADLDLALVGTLPGGVGGWTFMRVAYAPAPPKA